ncbi:hypothetical protein ANANG_G00073640 [Anguilla anguilla]|uniref:RRM domain-containing protein n=1 Tax=Anguilla anguilla TaxID=7936 RepID=A0A9D3S3I1_ANGAN|nr:hypothetical protein ANANG_G00073640 [Anguilla anguilla]
MQDEILGSEKPKAQQQEMQEAQEKQQSPAQQDAGIISELESSRSEEGKGENGSVDSGSGKEKLRMESPVLTGFDYQEPSGLGSGVPSSAASSSSLTGFNNWSPGVPPNPSAMINEDVSFFNPAASASNGPLLFQNFPHHVPHLANSLSKAPSPWGSYQSPSPRPPPPPGARGGYGGWGASQGREYRRGLNGGVTPLNSISPLKKSFPNSHASSQKYPRAAFNQKSWMDDSVSRSENIFPFQERTRSFDGFNMHSLENSLIDIMRAEQDSLKGRLGFPHPVGDSSLPINARNYGRRRGHSSLFPMEDGFADEERGDQGVAGLGFPHQNGERVERYSRKVFVGGLPPDIDEDEITASFRRFGHLFVDWPHKAESKSYFPPKGYAFLLFQDECSVQALIDACIEEDGKLYLCVSSPTIKDKPVQIRPWNLNDSDFVMDGSQPLDPRKTIFVGGVPRPLRAVELAMIMDRLYGGVCYAGIDTDPELKYPKGAGRVAFSNQQSYIAAISARFVQLQHGEIDKRVEVKPYVLDDQLCDECQGTRCGGKFAPFFCANVTCLQYYCEYCWAAIHSAPGASSTSRWSRRAETAPATSPSAGTEGAEPGPGPTSFCWSSGAEPGPGPASFHWN